MASSVNSKKKDKTAVLDGLVLDLFKRVEPVVEYSRLSPEEHLDGVGAIHRMLLQIQKAEKERIGMPSNVSSTPARSAEERMEELGLWLTQNGVKLEGLELRAGLAEGCGVVATRDFAAGEMVATLPQDLMMSALTAVQSEKDVAIIYAADAWFRAVPSLILAMHLLFEKHRGEPGSRWRGYIRSLPSQLSLQEGNTDGPEALLPLAFSMESISHLKGTTALVEYHRMFRTVAKQYCHMRTVLRQLSPLSPDIRAASKQWFSYAEFRWAVSMVMMRQNQIPVLGTPGLSQGSPMPPPIVGSTLALIPLLDMFNHEEGPISTHFDISSSRMEVAAKRAFCAGEQVYISYGFRPNAMLLLYNGFLPVSNARDRTRIPADLPTSDPLYSKKLSLLKWLEIAPSAQLDVFRDGSVSPQLATWLRVVSIREESKVTAELRRVISVRTEEAARRLQQSKRQEEGGRQLEGKLLAETDPRGPRESPGGGKAGGEENEAARSMQQSMQQENGQQQQEEGTQQAQNKPSRTFRSGGEPMEVKAELNGATDADADVTSAQAGGEEVFADLGPEEASLLAELCRKRADELLSASGRGGGSSRTAPELIPTGSSSAAAGKGDGSPKTENGTSAAAAAADTVSLPSPKGLGLGLRKGTTGARNSSRGSNASSEAVLREVAMTHRLWEEELAILLTAAEKWQGAH